MVFFSHRVLRTTYLLPNTGDKMVRWKALKSKLTVYVNVNHSIQQATGYWILYADSNRPIDEDSYYENTTWCNRDLIPIPPERRTWDVWGYFGMYPY